MPIEYAFKCRNCGTLEPPGAAGELDRPAKCHVCGKGAHFDPETGVRALDPENWIVLSELDDAAMADLQEFHQFDPDLHKIVAHAPFAAVPLGREPTAIDVTAAEGFGAADTDGSAPSEEAES